MPDMKRLRLCACIGLAFVSFGLIGAIVAQPLLSAATPPPSAIAVSAPGDNPY